MLVVAARALNEPEIFVSIQGEGRSMGRLRAFIRLSGCNLHCTWCDTPYTWNWHGTKWRHDLDRPGAPAKFSREDEQVLLTVEQAAAMLTEFGADGVVITGGEPLLQEEEVMALASRLKLGNPAIEIEVETNGTLIPSGELQEAVAVFMVSPKLSGAGDPERLRHRLPALRTFAQMPNAYFKFVVGDEGELEEVVELVTAVGIDRRRVYIMPQGTSSEAVAATGRTLIDPIIRERFNYSDRLHIHLFGDTRAT